MKSIPSKNPGAEADPLIFQWERRSWSRLRLLPMLLLSLVVHAASFYVLQVAYTPAGSQLPPPAQVVLLALDQPENASLGRWLAITDPGLMSRTAPPTAAQTIAALDFRYIPSFQAVRSEFKPLDFAGVNPATVSIPPRPHPTGPVPADLLPPLPQSAGLPVAPAASGRLPTRVVFTENLHPYAPSNLPPVRFSAGKIDKPLDPTVFLVGLRAGGMPYLFHQPTLFTQATSAEAEAEAYARTYLSKLEFRSPEQAANGPGELVVWGWATFCWGSDAY